MSVDRRLTQAAEELRAVQGELDPTRRLGQLRRRASTVQGSLGRVAATIPVCASPAGVEAGAGSLWVACPSDGVVVRVDPASGRVRATIPVGGEPAGLGTGGDAVWVALADQDVLLRIDPASDRVTASWQARPTAWPTALATSTSSRRCRTGSE